MKIMRVVFFDKMRETYHSVENVVQLENGQGKINGRSANLWNLILGDGSTQNYPQKWFSIYRIEI